MLSVLKFIEDESGNTKIFILWLLKNIEEARSKNNKYFASMDLHDLEINFTTKEIVISENLMEDEHDFIKLRLDDFYNDLLDLLNKD